MNNRVKFYSWLITQLSRRPMTFAEIADAWMDATANVYREELPLRTFQPYYTVNSNVGNEQIKRFLHFTALLPSL